MEKTFRCIITRIKHKIIEVQTLMTVIFLTIQKKQIYVKEIQ